MGPVSVEQDVDDCRSIVLLVEDEFLLRWPAGEFLRDTGYRVIEAATAHEAIAVLSSGAHVDIVFSDVNLTEDMSGHALASWIAKSYPRLPVLLTSGDRDALALVRVGATRSVLAKPYEFGELGNRIRELLSRG
jgi:DNA-binding NtrC family response regulator